MSQLARVELATPTHRRAIAVATLALAVAGCGSVSDQVAESVADGAVDQLAGEDVDIDMDDQGLSVESSEGSLSVGGEIPADFPDTVPLPEDHTVVSVVEQDGGDGQILGVQVQTPGTVTEWDAFYADALAEAGWTLDDEVFTAEQRQQSIETMGTSNLKATLDEATLLVGILPGNDDGTVVVQLNHMRGAAS